MRHLLGRRPSAAMVVAVIALVVAASGTAVAASKLVSGDSLIKKNSLSGNRLKNRSVTGVKIKVSSLGTVPSAKNAANAVNATNAANATNLGGQPASAFDASSNFTRTGYKSVSEGTNVTLATFGPFTLTLRCGTSSDGPNANAPAAAVTVSSSQAFATAGGQTINTAGGTAQFPVVQSSSTFDVSPTSFDENTNDVDFTAPGGAVWAGQIDAQVNNPGNGGVCGAIATIQKS